MHDDRCATRKGHPCNCASAAFDHLRQMREVKIEDSQTGMILPGAYRLIDRAIKSKGEAAVMHAIPSRRKRRRVCCQEGAKVMNLIAVVIAAAVAAVGSTYLLVLAGEPQSRWLWRFPPQTSKTLQLGAADVAAPVGSIRIDTLLSRSSSSRLYDQRGRDVAELQVRASRDFEALPSTAQEFFYRAAKARYHLTWDLWSKDGQRTGAVQEFIQTQTERGVY